MGKKNNAGWKERLTLTVEEAAVGLFEVKVREEKEIRDQAYEEGWEKGAAAAEELYSISYTCGVCGKGMVVTTGDEKKAIIGYIREHRWCHADCVARRC